MAKTYCKFFPPPPQRSGPQIFNHLFQSLGVVGGSAAKVEGDRIRGVLQHDRGGGLGPVAAQDCRPHNFHRLGQPGAACTGGKNAFLIPGIIIS